MVNHDRLALLVHRGAVYRSTGVCINARWREHFSKLLNRHPVVDHSVSDELRQLPTRDHMADPPTMEELIKAINQMKDHKAARADGIPAEVYKVGNKTLHDKLFALIF